MIACVLTRPEQQLVENGHTILVGLTQLDVDQLLEGKQNEFNLSELGLPARRVMLTLVRPGLMPVLEGGAGTVLAFTVQGLATLAKAAASIAEGSRRYIIIRRETVKELEQFIGNSLDPRDRQALQKAAESEQDFRAKREQDQLQQRRQHIMASKPSLN